MVDLSVKIGSLVLPNPVLVASGTFGCGEEMSELIDLGRLGGIVLKGTTLEPRTGNPTPRIVETPSGMLNAIGLQNVGLEKTLAEKVPFVKQFGIPAIINISGRTIDEYVEMARRIDACGQVDAIEVNVSCPNINKGGLAFGTDPAVLRDVTARVRAVTAKPVITKLSPNVTDSALMARAAQEAGADAVSLVNTFVGMVINTKSRTPVLANKTGGLSGPAIRPIAVFMTWQVAKAVTIPVIGMGGIQCLDDALQFFIAGASALQIGTANFYSPHVSTELVSQLKHYAKEQGLAKLTELRGTF